MPMFGSHLSISGGLYKAAAAAAGLGMETVQIFTGSPQIWSVSPDTASEGAARPKSKKGANSDQVTATNWQSKPLKEEDIRAFREQVTSRGLKSPCAHDSYLINLGSPDSSLRERSIAAFTVELERAEALGLAGVVMHPGTATDGDEVATLGRISDALDEVLRRCQGFAVEVWIETTAGQGATVGHQFEHLAELRKRSAQPQRLGVCVDTCHIFAAGYDIRTPQVYTATFERLNDTIGVGNIRAFHLNDSKKGLGSRVDRHEHIGEGQIGREAFRLLLNDSRFASLPMYLETKKEKRAGEEMDAVNLRTLRGLLSSG